jgi:hypothetical protein
MTKMLTPFWKLERKLHSIWRQYSRCQNIAADCPHRRPARLRHALDALERVRQQCADLHDQLVAVVPAAPPPIRIVDEGFALQRDERELMLRILSRAKGETGLIKEGIAEIKKQCPSKEGH